MALNNFELADGGVCRKATKKFPRRGVAEVHTSFDIITSTHVDLIHAGQNKTFEEIERLYYGITKGEVKWLLRHCSTCARTATQKDSGPVTPIVFLCLFERVQIDLID